MRFDRFDNLTFEAFRAEHYLAIQPAEGDFCRFTEKDLPHLRSMEIEGFSYTAFLDGKPVACGGVRPFWNGVGEAWALYPADMRQAAAPIWYCTKWIFNKIITEQRLWRVQAAVRCDFPAAMSFARKLGFVMEGCMKHYCMDRTDAFLYAYTREVK